MSTQPFTCYACGDGNTPLYCLNCAEKALETRVMARDKPMCQWGQKSDQPCTEPAVCFVTAFEAQNIPTCEKHRLVASGQGWKIRMAQVEP